MTKFDSNEDKSASKPAVAQDDFAKRNAFEQKVWERDWPSREKPPLYRNHENGIATTYRDPAVEAEWQALATASAAPAQSYCQVHCKKFCQNSVHGECDGAPAQSGEPETDLVLRCKELEELATLGESEQTALNQLANTYRKDISAHDRKAMANNQTHHEAMRFVIAAPQPAQTTQSDAGTYAEFGKARERLLSGEPVAMSGRTRELARQALAHRDNDTRTDEEKIAAAVDFICDTRLDLPAVVLDDERKIVGPVTVDRTHKNQAYVTIGFGSIDECSDFLGSLNDLYTRNKPRAASPQEKE